MMIRHIIVLLILNLAVSNAKSQGFDWAIGAGAWVDDSAFGLTTDDEGNIYVSGHLNSGTIIGNHTFENWGAYIFKMSTLGNVEWARSLGNFDTHAIDITIDSQGNVFLLGLYGKPIEIDGLSLNNGGGAFVLKLNSSGSSIWLKDYGYFIGNSIGVDKNDDFYIAGNFDNNLIFNDSTYTVRGRRGFDNDLILLKFNNNGIFEWIRNPGSSSNEYIYDMAINQSNIVVVGYLGGTELETSKEIYTASKNELGYILNYSLNGELQWFNSFEGPNHSDCFSVSIDNNNEVIVAGLWSEGNLFTEQNIFISKVGIDGDILNNILIPHNESLGRYVPGVFARKRWDITSSQRNIYLTSGFYGSKNIEHIEFNSNNDKSEIAILKLNEVGYPQWLSMGSGNGNDVGLRIEANESNIYVAGEYSSDQLTFGSILLNNNSGNGDNDFFVSKTVDSSSNLCPKVSSFVVSHTSSFCEGDSVLLSLENTYTTYTKWFLNGTELNWENKKHVYIKNPGTYEVLINENTRCPVPPIIIEVDINENQNSNTDILFNPLPKIEIEGPSQVCLSDTLNLSSVFDEEYVYSWNVPSPFFANDTTLNTLSVIVDDLVDSSVFYLEVYNINSGCFSIDSTIVKVNPNPNIKLQSNGKELSVSGNDIVLYKWFYENIELEYFENQKTITAEEIGNYYAIGISESGCSVTSDSVFIDRILAAQSFQKNLAVFPNPSTGLIFVNLEILPKRLEVIDLSGRLIKKNYNSSSIDIKDLKNGIYVLNIYHSNEIVPVSIIKI